MKSNHYLTHIKNQAKIVVITPHDEAKFAGRCYCIHKFTCGHGAIYKIKNSRFLLSYGTV